MKLFKKYLNISNKLIIFLSNMFCFFYVTMTYTSKSNPCTLLMLLEWMKFKVVEKYYKGNVIWFLNVPLNQWKIFNLFKVTKVWIFTWLLKKQSLIFKVNLASFFLLNWNIIFWKFYNSKNINYIFFYSWRA